MMRGHTTLLRAPNTKLDPTKAKSSRWLITACTCHLLSTVFSTISANRI